MEACIFRLTSLVEDYYQKERQDVREYFGIALDILFAQVYFVFTCC